MSPFWAFYKHLLGVAALALSGVLITSFVWAVVGVSIGVVMLWFAGWMVVTSVIAFGGWVRIWCGGWRAKALLVLLTVLGGWSTAYILHATETSVTTALYTIEVNATNSGSSDLTAVKIPFELSAALLIDGNFISSDALNTIIQRGATDGVSMPSSNRIQVKGAVLQTDAATFTEYTTAAQDATANDVSLLPVSPSTNSAFYFGCDNPCRIVTVDSDTAGVNTLTLTWEYWNGSAWTALADVDDRTTAFTVLGRRSVSWDMPTNWATNTVTGSAVTAYWARGRVSAFTSQTTQPLATKLWYETGLWWTWNATLNVNVQDQPTLYLGGSTNFVTFHQFFPGTAGITTPDDASIELGSSFALGISGRLKFTTTGSTVCIVCKAGAFSVYPSSSSAITLTVTGASTTTLVSNTITLPTSGSQRVIVASDGTNLVIIGNAGGGMVSGAAQSVTNNANIWTWVSKGAMDYLDFVRLDTVAPTTFEFQTSYTNFVTGTLTNVAAYTGALGLKNP